MFVVYISTLGSSWRSAKGGTNPSSALFFGFGFPFLFLYLSSKSDGHSLLIPFLFLPQGSSSLSSSLQTPRSIFGHFFFSSSFAIIPICSSMGRPSIGLADNDDDDVRPSHLVSQHFWPSPGQSRIFFFFFFGQRSSTFLVFLFFSTQLSWGSWNRRKNVS